MYKNRTITGNRCCYWRGTLDIDNIMDDLGLDFDGLRNKDVSNECAPYHVMVYMMGTRGSKGYLNYAYPYLFVYMILIADLERNAVLISVMRHMYVYVWYSSMFCLDTKCHDKTGDCRCSL